MILDIVENPILLKVRLITIKEEKKEEFALRLDNIEDSYYSFVVAVLTYVKKKTSRFEAVKKYMDDNPNALTSDILGFISEQEDFFEDAAYAHAEAS